MPSYKCLVEPEKMNETLYKIFNFLKENSNYTVEAEFTINPPISYLYSSVIICNDFLKNLMGALTIKQVIYNDPATIVFWEDGTKTVVKCQPGDTFSKEVGLAMAFIKKVYGNQSNYNDMFQKWA